MNSANNLLDKKYNAELWSLLRADFPISEFTASNVITDCKTWCLVQKMYEAAHSLGCFLDFGGRFFLLLVLVCVWTRSALANRSSPKVTHYVLELRKTIRCSLPKLRNRVRRSFIPQAPWHVRRSFGVSWPTTHSRNEVIPHAQKKPKNQYLA